MKNLFLTLALIISANVLMAQPGGGHGFGGGEKDGPILLFSNSVWT